MMDILGTDSLVLFCIRQRFAFDTGAWRRRSAADGKVIALTAKYLSMTSWFGREDELERIALELDAVVVGTSEFQRNVRAIGLDLGYISARVRFGIAEQQVLSVNLTIPSNGGQQRWLKLEVANCIGIDPGQRPASLKGDDDSILNRKRKLE